MHKFCAERCDGGKGKESDEDCSVNLWNENLGTTSL
jgi:hypothetical protein